MEEMRKWAGWIAVLVLASMVLLAVPRGAVVLAVSAAAGGLYWLLRRKKVIKPAQMLADQSADGPRFIRNAAAGPDPDPAPHRHFNEVRDVRLAAVILMIQLVRTGAPLTAAETNAIFDLMAHPLEVDDRQGLFELAWRMTDQGRVFSPVADELAPLLIECLTRDERLEFIEMLTRVANAYCDASDLQREAIVRLKRRLTSALPTPNLRLN